MIKSIVYLVLIGAFTLLGASKEPEILVKNKSFTNGERLLYRVHWGMINGGEAEIKIDNSIHKINGRPCFKIDVFGKTNSTVGIFTKVRDNWGTYMDTTALLPHMSYRKIREGKYSKNEVVHFNHSLSKAEVKDLKDKQSIVVGKYNIPGNIQDVVSGFFYVRAMDFNKLHINEVIPVKAFLEDTTYTLKVKYLGKEVIDTKLGAINCIKLSPMLGENKLFDGENALSVWLSDDSNKIPMKITADLKYIGEVSIDIKKHEGLRN